MKLKTFLFLLISLLSFTSVNAIVLTVHGGFNGGQSDWHKADGDFFLALKQEAENLGHELKTFRWSQPIGGILDAELIYAGHQLAQTITEHHKKDRRTEQFFDNNKVILIGHSYGGIVSYYASDFLNKTTWLTPFPLLEGKQFFAQHSFLQTNWKTCTKLLSGAQSLILGKKKKKFPIDTLYALGTPHGNHSISPDMATINKLYNIYSEGDFIGTKLIGSWSPPASFKTHTRIANIQITHFKDGALIHPNHEMLRYPIMGKWILHVPTIFKNKFSFSKTGKITFYYDQHVQPTYCII